jgi:hypothetical protein
MQTAARQVRPPLEARKKGPLFQPTVVSWIGGQLDLGDRGRSDLNRHIWETYYGPLWTLYRKWVKQARCQDVGTPDDVVTGFFVSRLSRPDYMRKWYDGGRPKGWKLHDYLIHTLRGEYIHERARELKRNGKYVFLPEPPDPMPGPDPGDGIDAIFRDAVVDRTCQLLRRRCCATGRKKDWIVFKFHVLRRLKYPRFCGRLGLRPNEAAKLVQRLKTEIESIVHEVLRIDGIAPGDIDREIQALLEID